MNDVIVFPIIVVVRSPMKVTLTTILFVVSCQKILLRWPRMMVMIYRRLRKLSVNSVFEITVVRLFEERLVSCLSVLLSSSIAPPPATSGSMASATGFPTVSTTTRAL